MNKEKKYMRRIKSTISKGEADGEEKLKRID